MPFQKGGRRLRGNLLISSTILVIGSGGTTLTFGEGGFAVSSMALSALLPGRGTGAETALASH
jgi:uracil permease